jgi:hypothetical protein
MRRSPRRLVPAVLTLALLSLVAVAPAANAQLVNVTSGVATNTTWGPTGTAGFVGTTFWVKNSITIQSGATLTIQPGVVVKFAAGAQLYVAGALQAVGTSGAGQIYFTSIKDDNIAGDTNGDGNATVPNAGDWSGVLWPSSSLSGGSALTYCVVRYAGYGNVAALTFQSVSDNVTNCIVSKSYYGVDCQGTAAPTLSNTSIQASTLTPIVLDFTATPVFSSLVFSTSDNGYDAIGLRGGTLTSTVTLPKRGATVGVNPTTNVTYVLLGSLTINAGASLTVNPGVVIKPLGAWFYVYGNLAMNGTSAAGDTITITSIKDDNFGTPNDTNNNGSINAPVPGDWGSIYFYPGATGSISYCRLKFGVNNNSYGVITEVNTSINVSNSLLSDASHGLALFGISSPNVTNVQINNCTSTPVLQSVSSNAVYTGVGLTANAITAIGLQGEAVAVDGHLTQRTLGGYVNMTYYIMNGLLDIQSGATLTVDPGVVIKNQLSGGGIQVDGALVANGTALNPIVFTSERDDQYGNPQDTNGDGSSTTPAQGNWTYLHYTDTANDVTCILNNCRISYASSQPYDGYAANIWITNASPTITNSLIFKGYYGIRSEGNSAPVISADTFDNLGAAPIVMSVLSDPQIATNNTYTTNVYNALALMGETLSQNALLKYRPNVGNPASPTFCYLPTGTITIASGVTLSIQPQVVLKPSSSFTLFSVNGALNMVGSDNTTHRIFITSNLDDALGGDTTPNTSSLPNAGNWGNIVFNDTSVDPACIVRNVKFQFGGSGGNTGGVLTCNSAAPRFVRLEFFQNVTAFTIAGNSTPSLDSLNILNCTGLPIVTSLISHPSYGPVIAFANCSYLGLGILGETVAQDVLLGVGQIGSYSNLNYILGGNVTIAFGAKWTVNPGVVIKMGRIFTADPAGNSIDISGALYANGKPDSLIVFTSMADDAFGQDAMGDGAATQPVPGNWYGIQFEAVSNDAATLLNHCRIRYSGYSYGSLIFVSAGPAVSNTQITRSNAPAAYVSGASTPVFTNVDFDSTAAVGSGVPVELSLVSDPVFNNCRFQGNWYTALGVIPETIAQDVLWKIRPCAGRLNMPFFLNGPLTVGLGATLTMQPGVIVKGYNASMLIQRAISAIGRTVPESLIVFTSYRDDFYGGDSNADSNYTAPAAGDWSYVDIDGTAIDPEVNFRNCVFRYSYNGPQYGALRCVSSAPTVDSCLFAYNGTGISAEGASAPAVHGCSFYSNTYYAINNTGNAFCVAAPGCWWGSASGPNDASATADLCGLGANAGTGDVVSNNVNYTGYATTGIQNPLLGDVSLNGFVMAYDASLILQSSVSLITLSPLQALVGDVDANGAVAAFDATLVLRLVAGKISAFPPISNGLRKAPPLPTAMQAFVDAARGTFQLALGQAVRAGDEWLVPVTVTGTAPVYSVELTLDQGDAASLASVAPAGGALMAQNVTGGSALVAMASTDPLPAGDAMVLHFPAGSGDFQPPHVAFARVNQVTITRTPLPVTLPAVSFLGRPWPNPAKGSVTMQLAIAAPEATAHANVRVVDVAGRTLRTLLDGPLAAGTRTLEWDLTDDARRAVPPGMYFVRARAAGSAWTQRLVVVR